MWFFCSSIRFPHLLTATTSSATDNCPKVASCPPGSQAASLDMIRAYRNSPLAPAHKPHVASMWHGSIYIDHCAMEGLSTAGNIQGGPADVLLAILHSKSIGPALKWVDDFVFFHAPTYCDTDAVGTVSYSYSYDLASVMKITDPLGIPWHPIEVKGQDFRPLVSYVGFVWNLELHTISLSPKKRTKYLEKVRSSLHTSNALSRKHCTSILRTLQHILFIYRDGRSRLPPFVSFISKFP